MDGNYNFWLLCIFAIVTIVIGIWIIVTANDLCKTPVNGHTVLEDVDDCERKRNILYWAGGILIAISVIALILSFVFRYWGTIKDYGEKAYSGARSGYRYISKKV